MSCPAVPRMVAMATPRVVLVGTAVETWSGAVLKGDGHRITVLTRGGACRVGHRTRHCRNGMVDARTALATQVQPIENPRVPAFRRRLSRVEIRVRLPVHQKMTAPSRNTRIEVHVEPLAQINSAVSVRIFSMKILPSG